MKPDPSKMENRSIQTISREPTAVSAISDRILDAEIGKIRSKTFPRTSTR